VLLSLSQQEGTCPLSEIRVTTVSDTAGTGPVTLTKQSAAKAWANYDTTGTTEFRDSFNFSSLTDNNTGDTTLNVTNSFSNANYTVAMMGGRAGATGSFFARYNDNLTVPTASLFRVQLIDYNGNGTDGDRITMSCQGDLA